MDEINRKGINQPRILEHTKRGPKEHDQKNWGRENGFVLKIKTETEQRKPAK